jgi:threonine dehydrogenase-like Zn-dependent dehydrogenase
METMTGLWLEDRQLSLRENLLRPAQASGEALVRVRMAGVCATDLEMVRGYYPFTGILGHEFVGEVAAAPEPGWAGQRVVGEINAACGECEPCRAGRPTHCARRNVLGILNRNGAFAAFLSLPLVNLHRVPESVPDECAVFTEPLAAALQVQEQAPVRPTDRVLVIGAGRLGQLIAQTLALTGCELSVVARHPQQVALLMERGIRTVQAKEVADRSQDMVVEATGTPGGFEMACQAVRARGTIVLKSTYAGNVEINLSAVVVDEITLIGSRCGPFGPALRLLAEGRVDPRPLIAARYPLSQAVQAMQQAAQPGVLKVLIEMGE